MSKYLPTFEVEGIATSYSFCLTNLGTSDIHFAEGSREVDVKFVYLSECFISSISTIKGSSVALNHLRDRLSNLANSEAWSLFLNILISSKSCLSVEVKFIKSS